MGINGLDKLKPEVVKQGRPFRFFGGSLHNQIKTLIPEDIYISIVPEKYHRYVMHVSDVGWYVMYVYEDYPIEWVTAQCRFIKYISETPAVW